MYSKHTQIMYSKQLKYDIKVVKILESLIRNDRKYEFICSWVGY